MSGTIETDRTWQGAITSFARREVLSWPNLVTALRAGCALGIAFFAGSHMTVFVLFTAGAISDALDGFIAKRFGWCTRFGKHFDQFADWGMGTAILYAVFMAEGLTWYNIPPLLAIGGYLVARLGWPIMETSALARKKTIVQYVGGVLILMSYATESTASLALGYALIWVSLWFMLKSLRQLL